MNAPDRRATIAEANDIADTSDRPGGPTLEMASPREMLLAWLITIGDSASDVQLYAIYRLTTVDGDEVHLTVEQFLKDNEDERGGEVETAIRSLAVGETYRGGGGAAPQWSIRRLT